MAIYTSRFIVPGEDIAMCSKRIVPLLDKLNATWDEFVFVVTGSLIECINRPYGLDDFLSMEALFQKLRECRRDNVSMDENDEHFEMLEELVIDVVSTFIENISDPALDHDAYLEIYEIFHDTIIAFSCTFAKYLGDYCGREKLLPFPYSGRQSFISEIDVSRTIGHDIVMSVTRQIF